MREKCQAYEKSCGKCEKSNHFARVCKQRGRRIKRVNTVSVSSSDSSESLFTFQLTPEINSVHVIRCKIPSKITATIKLKGGPEIHFQVDVGATCYVLKLSSIKGKKYANETTPTN